MPWNKNLSNIRNVLAGLYWTVDDARRLVQEEEIDLNPANIKWDSRPIILWHNILEQAQHHNKVSDIITKAREEYPAVQSLALAQENLLLSIETPALRDGEWSGPRSEGQLEKIIGSLSTLRPISFLERGMEVARSVARVVLADGSIGSGFLIANKLLITNNHVIPSLEVASQATIQFNYQQTIHGTYANVDTYRLVPDRGFATSPDEEHGGDDWTAVRVDGEPNETWGSITFTHNQSKVRDECIIVQHPGGGPKQVALSHNIVVFVNERRLQYLTDTMEGSSGSPVFNAEWQLIALHHKGGLIREPNTTQTYFRNQGIHINTVIDGLTAVGLL